MIRHSRELVLLCEYDAVHPRGVEIAETGIQRYEMWELCLCVSKKGTLVVVV